MTLLQGTNPRELLVEWGSVAGPQGFSREIFAAPIALTPLAVEFVVFTSVVSVAPCGEVGLACGNDRSEAAHADCARVLVPLALGLHGGGLVCIDLSLGVTPQKVQAKPIDWKMHTSSALTLMALVCE